jgi:hypothetical protein
VDFCQKDQDIRNRKLQSDREIKPPAEVKDFMIEDGTRRRVSSRVFRPNHDLAKHIPFNVGALAS